MIGLIVFVAALNILISLTMMVMEKTRDIAVMIPMGRCKSQVWWSVYHQRFVDWSDWHGDRVGARAKAVLGGRPLPFLLLLAPEVYSINDVSVDGGAIDGALVALVAIGISLIATFLSLLVGSADSPRGSIALRASPG